MSATAMVLAILALFTSIVKWNCDYLSADVSLSKTFTGFRNVPEGQDNAYYALGTYEDKFQPPEDDSWEYKRYNSDQLDDMGAAFRAARIFALVGMGLIGIPAIVLLAVPCVEYKQYVFKGCGMMLLLGSVCEVLTFLSFGSDLCKDYNCNWEIGSLPAMASTVLAICTGVLTLKIGKPRETELAQEAASPEASPEAAPEAAPEASPEGAEMGKKQDAEENA